MTVSSLSGEFTCHVAVVDTFDPLWDIEDFSWTFEQEGSILYERLLAAAEKSDGPFNPQIEF